MKSIINFFLVIPVLIIVSCSSPVIISSEKTNETKKNQIINANVITNVTNIEKTTIELIKKELNVDVSPENIRYEVSDPSVAFVSPNGTLTPLKKGTVDVMVKDKINGNTLKKFTMDVEPYSDPVFKMKKGEILQLELNDPDLDWSSSNLEVAAASNGTVYARSEGKAEVIARTKDKKLVTKVIIIIESV